MDFLQQSYSVISFFPDEVGDVDLLNEGVLIPPIVVAKFMNALILDAV
jgi:hypothetical protein